MLKQVHDFVDMISKSTGVPAMFERAGFSRADFDRFRDRVVTGFRDPPRIAVIGETGVGKSTTLNALFNAGQAISHTRACTQIESELTVDSGKLRVFDMPGLGEDIDRDKEHLETYARVLPQCDAAVWILKADNRAVTNVQRSLQTLVDRSFLQARRLVIAVNQVDLVQPGTWQTKFNMPDEEQETSIAERLLDVREKINRVVPVPKDRVVAYSALKHYGLPDLLAGIQAAADRSRMWLIQDRANFLSFDELAEVGDG